LLHSPCEVPEKAELHGDTASMRPGEPAEYARRTASLMDDAQLAAAIAKGAGSILLGLRETKLFSGRWLGAAGDARAQRFIASELAEHRPEDPVLSEETEDNLARLDSERVWIIDPLDGTREYSEGRSDWAVHVALAIRGAPKFGAVALPDLDLFFSTDALSASPAAGRDKLKVVVSRTRLPAEAERVAERLGAELLPMGSAGAKAMAVVRGLGDIYVHSGGQHEWDSCAPVAVAKSYGLHCSRLDGSPLVYNQENPYLPDLLICREELSRPVLEALRT
jgi:3'(2'), 5'-bisphosphate nucleotidase